MPTLNRPNAPERLPSTAIEKSFFQLRPRRSAGSAGSLNPWSPASSPSPVSPTTLVAQKRASKADRRRLLSDGNAKTTWTRESVSTPTALNQMAPITAQEEPSLLKHRVSSGSLTSEPCSSRSSISSRARKFLNTPNLRIAGTATKNGGPPRDAKRGFRWQHEISGHWLEIRIGRTRRSAGQSRSVSGAMTPLSRVTPAATKADSSTGFNKPSTMDDAVQGTPRTTSQGISPITPKLKEGLYCRTKRQLGLKRAETDKVNPASPQRTMTGEVLDRTASMLRLLVDKKHTPPSSSTSASNLSTAAQRRQVLRPSHTPLSSTSSSIRSLMMGKPPTTTPEAQETYVGSDQREYFTVELTEPGAPAFLPSEARRINTPPLKSAGSGNSKIRGFFFDYNPPSEDDTSEKRYPHNSTLEVHPHIQRGKDRRLSATEWYRSKLVAVEAEELWRDQLVSQVPDHLPNSHLCPRHPKHKNGGTGVCPMHGRNETSRASMIYPTPSPGPYTDSQTHPPG